jgi:hypothetical protein
MALKIENPNELCHRFAPQHKDRIRKFSEILKIQQNIYDNKLLVQNLNKLFELSLEKKFKKFLD